MLEIGLTHFLVVSAIVFSAGLAVMVTKRNAVGILIGVELILNAAILNFVAFGRYRVGGVDGQIAALVVIALAAAEAVIALAIFLSFYHTHATIDVDRGDTLQS